MKYFIFIILLLAPAIAQATDCTSFANNINHPLDEKVVNNLAETTENSVESTLKNEKETSPAEYQKAGMSLEEFKRPMLQLADNFRIFDRGVLGSFQDFCKVGDSSAQVFSNFMINENAKNHWSKIQDFYIMVMYVNVKKLMDKNWTDTKEECQPNVKEIVQNYINECKP